MQTISLIIIACGGAWLVVVGVFMAARPAYCCKLFADLSSKLQGADQRLDIIEQALRLLVGAALILRAVSSKLPLLLSVFGWMLVVSSLIILALPVRWHGAFGSWWAPLLTPARMRVLSVVPLLAGPALVYIAI